MQPTTNSNKEICKKNLYMPLQAEYDHLIQKYNKTSLVMLGILKLLMKAGAECNYIIYIHTFIIS